jgi:hypothetical protein
MLLDKFAGGWPARFPCRRVALHRSRVPPCYTVLPEAQQGGTTSLCTPRVCNISWPGRKQVILTVASWSLYTDKQRQSPWRSRSVWTRCPTQERAFCTKDQNRLNQMRCTISAWMWSEAGNQRSQLCLRGRQTQCRSLFSVPTTSGTTLLQTRVTFSGRNYDQMGS